MHILNIIHFRLKRSITNEQGFVFVYLLIILLVVTTVLSHHLSLQHIQTENFLLIQEQQKIQQLIQIARHDLQEIIDQTLENEGTVQFEYLVGQVTCHYTLESPSTYQVQLIVETPRGTTYENTTLMNKSDKIRQE
uniref:competence type IV pilus minor pilin ComGG n=1 Tax=uncultured Allobacillus sp. TaxID=1638025 RepID=UPI0025992132|nr:competence type IV pilus minor pilin ComGG [uncultured Allobacillus sp.]